ncbi:MAG: CDP-alcohol phosphatidyltransferase family protein [Acidobacteriota bacterium]
MSEVRENSGVLAAAEKRALVWMAARMPRRINSDHLTGVAAIATVVTGAGFALGPSRLSGVVLIVLGLAFNWFGDSLDGTLARVRNQQRPRYGYYVDHVLDSAGMLVLFGGMAIGGYLAPVTALATLVAYYLLSIEVYLATYALGTFRMSFWKIGPTELRIILAGGAIAVYGLQPQVVMFGMNLQPFDAGAAIGAAGLTLTAIRSAIGNTRALYRAEPIAHCSQT